MILRISASVVVGLQCAAVSAGPVSFENASNVVEIKPEASTGLAAVYVVENVSGLSMVYTAASASSAVQWQRFSNLGGAYAEDVAPTRNGNQLTLPCDKSDMGYIITENGRQTCFWVVDYAQHEFAPESLMPSPENSDCSRSALTFVGKADAIPYYSINGRRLTLSREIDIEYNTLEFDEDNFVYNQVSKVETISEAGSVISVPAALCSTEFSISGDRFLEAWNRGKTVSSVSVVPIAVEAHTRATQTPRDADNEQKDNTEGLGGSAPCEIVFDAAVSDEAIYNEWQISRQPDFTTIENSYNDLSFTYTFTENGTTYVRFLANNADGTCPFESQVYEVFVGESKLDIPNAFSPGTSPGVNDEWKVSYKSLVSYSCHIFNSWGKQLFSSTDPSQGWDGKVGNKVVPAGVYYYVIEAVGADGIQYKKSGDINIIGYKQGSSSSTTDPVE